MVDQNLPFEKLDFRPLRVLFLDLNSYFASVEQQERPELRGAPTAVVPLQADSTCVIAASYEAKAYGVKTGTLVGDARRMCPDLRIVLARPPLYVRYHETVKEAVESVLPIEKVCSIDEMYCRIIGKEQEPSEATRIARKIKRKLAEHAGPALKASIGVAPNAFLAKVATDLEKPDGLVVLTADTIESRLSGLRPSEFAGINKKMEARLNSAGIFDSDGMYRATKVELRKAFGSILGERWWYLLRGYELEVEARERQSLGHSHVLPPELRNDTGCREVLLRLVQKASARLRTTGMWAHAMSVSVTGKTSWSVRTRLPPTQDSLTITESLLELWEARSFQEPKAVGVTFHDLREAEAVTPSLFDQTFERSKFSQAMDQINQRFGKNKIYLAGMEHAKDTADEKIAFQKTELFDEGLGDNQE